MCIGVRSSRTGKGCAKTADKQWTSLSLSVYLSICLTVDAKGERQAKKCGDELRLCVWEETAEAASMRQCVRVCV